MLTEKESIQSLNLVSSKPKMKRGLRKEAAAPQQRALKLPRSTVPTTEPAVQRPLKRRKTARRAAIADIKREAQANKPLGEILCRRRGEKP
jgi:hypothetical protein